MAEILVLAAHDGESVKKVTLELLTLARRFGDPAAVWLGPGADAGRERVGAGGAAAEESIFGGAIIVKSRVTTGTPIVAVRPNAVAPEASPGAAALEPVSV